MTQNLLQLTQLTKRFGAFTAVRNLNLRVGSGEILALLGPNGSGKTTTMRMIVGQLCPSHGTATMEGRDCFRQRAEVMRRVGYLPDDPVFPEYLTGRELLRFVGGLHRLNTAQIEQMASVWSRRLGLDEALDEYAVNYSRGMKKKLGLAMALIHQPALLILDEPTSGLDPHVTRTLLTIITEKATTGVGIVFSTHLLNQAERLCHQAAIISEGQLLAQETLKSLRTDFASGGSLAESPLTNMPPGFMLLLLVGLAPLIEEFIFRGLLFAGLHAMLPLRWAVPISAAVFALIHPAAGVLPVFGLGCIAALVYHHTGWLLAPILAHAVYNAGLQM